MPGAENIRAVQMVALLAAGMGLGVALAHVKLLWGMQSANNSNSSDQGRQ
jgi:hypothetical protein